MKEIKIDGNKPNLSKAMENIKSISKSLGKMAASTINLDDLIPPQINVSDYMMPNIDFEPIELPGHRTNELLIEYLEIAKKQINLLEKSLKQTTDSNDVLQEQYKLQLQVNKDSADELKKSRKFNRWTLALAIISLVVSIAIGFFA